MKKITKLIRIGYFLILIIIFSLNKDILSKTASDSMADALTLQEALDSNISNWTTGGNADWITTTSVSYFGGASAQSGTIGDNQESRIQAIVIGPGPLDFYWKVSSEDGFDYLIFYIDGEVKTQITGSTIWQKVSYYLPRGNHTLTWAYRKNYENSSGSDCGWLDKVEFTSKITLDKAKEKEHNHVSITFSKRSMGCEMGVDDPDGAPWSFSEFNLGLAHMSIPGEEPPPTSHSFKGDPQPGWVYDGICRSDGLDVYIKLGLRLSQSPNIQWNFGLGGIRQTKYTMYYSSTLGYMSKPEAIYTMTATIGLSMNIKPFYLCVDYSTLRGAVMGVGFCFRS
jgi:hypothetical protein